MYYDGPYAGHVVLEWGRQTWLASWLERVLQVGPNAGHEVWLALTVSRIKRYSSTLLRQERPMKEATARIKINKLLEAAAGDSFRRETSPPISAWNPGHDQDHHPCARQTLKTAAASLISCFDLGPDSRSARRKSSVSARNKHENTPVANCRFVILSNGNLHFWDLERGNRIHHLVPAPDSIMGCQKVEPDSQRLLSSGCRRLYR